MNIVHSLRQAADAGIVINNLVLRAAEEIEKLRADHDSLLSNYLSLTASVRMIRQAIEQSFGAAAELSLGEYYATPHKECEAMAMAISTAARELHEQIEKLRGAPPASS